MMNYFSSSPYRAIDIAAYRGAGAVRGRILQNWCLLSFLTILAISSMREISLPCSDIRAGIPPIAEIAEIAVAIAQNVQIAP